MGTRGTDQERRSRRPGRARSLVAVGAAVAALTAGTSVAHAERSGPARPAAPAAPSSFSSTGPGLLGHDGRWLTDSQGRVVLMHGVNLVAKDLRTPAERGFDDDDAQWLQDNGFDAVRLGLSGESLMPTPGVIDTAYLASFAQTAQLLTDHGLLVLIDLHQDGWGPTTSGNGFADWMTFTHGAQNTHTGFPLYYITNPAIQAAFDSFWNNEQSSDGVGIEDQVATMFKALAGAVGSNPDVLGYDILNEPWPGTDWGPCINDPDGCPARDASGLDQLHDKVTTAIRSEDSDHLVFGEPYVLFNFGQSKTHIALPGGDANSGMSWHMYTTDVKLEPNVIANALGWSHKTGGALLNTEFGAVTKPADIDRMVGEMDNALMPWLWWSYDEFVSDMTADPTASINTDVSGALIRPHPVQVAGTPSALDYDRAGQVLRFTWDAASPDGTRLPAGTETVIKVPPSVYGSGGYSVKVTGGTVTSAADADELIVTTDPGAASTFVKVWAAGTPEPPDVKPTDTTTTTTAGSGTSTTVATEPADTADAATPVAGSPTFTG
ncbi:cellulase family glycosylhydrolase [Aquihabitans sp. McL0605]|uniref:cellulase family glycosylhydrolase n=1 Tax=Aquihabitans sp. McL0605 TaxID=3415671 RepID=UPI003CF0C2A6